MPFLQSSGTISINDIKNLFGGPASPSLSNYYRGGAYIPASKTVTVTEGPFYSQTPPQTRWIAYDNNNVVIYWNDATIVNAVLTNGATLTSYSAGGYTYFRGTLSVGAKGLYSYYISRSSSSSASINGGIPSSGTIRLNNFYGAEKP